MSRVLTTYKRPSIQVQLETCPDIERLNVLRVLITIGIQKGVLHGEPFTPDKGTVAKWAQAQWNAVVRLMFTATRPGDLCYIYNLVAKWPKDAQTAAIIEESFRLRALVLPSDAEALLAQGIEIEGITKLPVKP
jgi:hypothetical protein